MSERTGPDPTEAPTFTGASNAHLNSLGSTRGIPLMDGPKDPNRNAPAPFSTEEPLGLDHPGVQEAIEDATTNDPNVIHEIPTEVTQAGENAPEQEDRYEDPQ